MKSLYYTSFQSLEYQCQKDKLIITRIETDLTVGDRKDEAISLVLQEVHLWREKKSGKSYLEE